MALTHVPALDGLRGIAIALVIGFHEVREFLPGGSIGVDLFFVLSSFLITSLLASEFADHGRVDYRNFYWRRVVRLGPALLLFLAVVAPVIGVITSAPYMLSNSLATILYASDFASAGYWFTPMTGLFGHTWSLAVEEQFYLVWPLVAAAILKRRGDWLRLALIFTLVSAAIGILSSLTLGAAQTYFLPTGHLVALAGGILVFALAERPRRKGFRHPARWLEVLAWVMVASQVTMIDFIPEFWQLPVGWVGIAAFVVLLLSCLGKSWTASVLAKGPLVWLGLRSYGLYLYSPAIHFAFVQIAPDQGISRRVAIALSVALSCVAAELSYRFVESPLRSRGRAWLPKNREAIAH